MKSKWKKLSSKIIHKNPWFTLRRDGVTRPNGSKGEYFVIDVNSVAIIAEDSDGKIYLVGQTRYSIGNIYSWEVVTGGFKSDLKPLEVAKCELKEEAGLIADEWTNLGHFHPVSGYASEKTSIYLANNLRKTKQLLDPTEDITVKKETVERVVEMIKNNEITSGITIVAIYKYLLYRDKFK